MSFHKKNFIPDLLEFPKELFKDHLEIEENNRILFSGKFGIGKSVFLESFFNGNPETNSPPSNYNVFHLYPVNYSIASNEDIYRYIKYDIIISMLKQATNVRETTISFLQSLDDYLKKSALKVFSLIPYMASKVDEKVSVVYERIEEILEGVYDHYKNLKPSDAEHLIKFLNETDLKEGSIFENDLITKIIESNLEYLQKSTGKKNVLIIDDLDRVDPEHIFRLLNVFAAHLNADHSVNKLGFNKVVLVCDVTNIKDIFAAKYGQKTDFNGYIDKFYSKEIFHLDNNKVLQQLAYDCLSSLSVPKQFAHNEAGIIMKALSGPTLGVDLIRIFTREGFINLRTILKIQKHKIKFNPNKDIEFSHQRVIRLGEYPVLSSLYIVSCIVGGFESLKDIVSKIPSEKFTTESIKYFCLQFLYWINAPSHKLTPNKDFYIQFNGSNHKIELNPEKMPFELIKTDTGAIHKFNKNDFKNLLLELIRDFETWIKH